MAQFKQRMKGLFSASESRALRNWYFNLLEFLDHQIEHPVTDSVKGEEGKENYGDKEGNILWVGGGGIAGTYMTRW